MLNLNIENAKKWVEALRSGKYKQARGVVYRNKVGGSCENVHEAKAFCCLGVANKIAHDEAGDIANPDELLYREYLNLPVNMPKANEVIYKLIALNDRQFCSFDQIADYVVTLITEEEKELGQANANT